LQVHYIVHESYEIISIAIITQQKWVDKDSNTDMTDYFSIKTEGG